MEMKEIALRLGVESYPECFEELYKALEENTEPACDLELIRTAQEKYAAFGKYFDFVLEGAEQINADPVCSAWVKVVTAFLSDEKWGKVADVPVVPLNDTPKQNVLMMAALIPFIPTAAARYRKSGFNEEQIASYLQAYDHCMNSTKIRTGQVGLDTTYFRWLHHFAKAEIFRVHGIQFEFTTVRRPVAFLRNKETGQIIPVMTGGVVHSSGKMMLGAAGYEDETDAFEPVFSEDAEKFVGHGVYDAVISRKTQEYPKSRWECFAKQGDKCMGIHLPRGADISPEHIRTACKTAYEIIEKSYPDYIGVPVHVGSWLLDPNLETFVGPDSNIIRFARMFVPYPTKSRGRAADSFVFPGRYEKVEDLPENTRLQRAMKQHYLNGGYTYSYGGILLP